MGQVWRSPVGTLIFGISHHRLYSLGGRLVFLAQAVVGAATITLCAAQGVASAQDLPEYEVTGFRGATFGMTEPDIRAIVTKTLGVKAADFTSTANPVEGTTVPTAKVASLDPG